MRSTRKLIAMLASLLALGLLAVAPVGAQDGGTLEIDLAEIDGSGVSGTAILTQEDGGVLVEIEVTGDAVVGGHPVHIHTGTCDNLDPAPEYPLPDIDEDGLSSTLVEGVTLEELQASPYAVNVHLSNEEIGVYVACGNIAAAGEAAPPAATEAGVGAATTTAPSTGTGDGLVGGDSNGMLAGLLALAGVLAVAGVALRLRETRA